MQWMIQLDLARSAYRFEKADGGKPVNRLNSREK